MFDFKTLLAALWPKNGLGGIDEDGDLAKLFEGLSEDYQAIYEKLKLLARVRDPRLTESITDLEREYGLVPNTALSDETRRTLLTHSVYRRPTTASWEHLQNALINAGFIDVIVTPNNPVVDPANVTIDSAELIVNGSLYTDQTPAYYMAASSGIAYAGHSRGYAGYYLDVDKTEKTYTIPTEIEAHWAWRYVFWVGGAASGWPASPAIAKIDIDKQKETEIKNLIMRYKPAFTWCMTSFQLSTMLAGTAPGGLVLRSSDYGDTWTSVGQLGSQTRIYSLEYVNSGVFLAGTYNDGEIHRSVDYGLTWTNIGQLASETTIRALKHIGNNICLAGTSPNGHIFRSEDGGETWTDLGQQYSQSAITCFESLNNGIILAGTENGGLILRSTDYGQTWTSLGQQFSQVGILSLAYLGNKICIAGTETGGLILRSTDLGETWTSLGQQASQSYIISLLSLGNGICLAGTASGGLILRSIDWGLTWATIQQLGSETQIWSLTTPDNNIVIAGTYPNGKLFKSDDLGMTWSDLGQQASQNTIYSLCSR